MQVLLTHLTLLWYFYLSIMLQMWQFLCWQTDGQNWLLYKPHTHAYGVMAVARVVTGARWFNPYHTLASTEELTTRPHLQYRSSRNVIFTSAYLIIRKKCMALSTKEVIVPHSKYSHDGWYLHVQIHVQNFECIDTNICQHTFFSKGVLR